MFIPKGFKSNVLEVFILKGLRVHFSEVRILQDLAVKFRKWKIENRRMGEGKRAERHCIAGDGTVFLALITIYITAGVYKLSRKKRQESGWEQKNRQLEVKREKGKGLCRGEAGADAEAGSERVQPLLAESMDSADVSDRTLGPRKGRIVDRSGTNDRGADVNLGADPNRMLVGGGDAADKSINMRGTNEIDGAAAEAAAGHARAIKTRLGIGDLHHAVQFGATDFV